MALTVPVLMRLMSDGFILLYRFAPAFEAYLTPTSFLVLSGEPLADVNYAGILDGLDAEERLRRIGDIVKERDLPFILFLVSEVAAELAPIAHELGLENVGSMPFMTYEPDAPPAPPERYAIEQVRSGKALKEANDVLAQAFALPLESVARVFTQDTLAEPDVELFLAREDGDPISAVWTTEHGTVVGIWAMGTTPEHQRKGAGRALLTEVISRHYERGARQFYLGATLEGRELYEHTGFQRVGEPAVWVAGRSTQMPGKEDRENVPV